MTKIWEFNRVSFIANLYEQMNESVW